MFKNTLSLHILNAFINLYLTIFFMEIKQYGNATQIYEHERYFQIKLPINIGVVKTAVRWNLISEALWDLSAPRDFTVNLGRFLRGTPTVWVVEIHVVQTELHPEIRTPCTYKTSASTNDI